MRHDDAVAMASRSGTGARCAGAGALRPVAAVVAVCLCIACHLDQAAAADDPGTSMSTPGNGAVLDPTPPPLAAVTAPASADECAVWRRELSFARSVETHDAAAFASHVEAGAVFDAGTTDATRGRDAVVDGWKTIVDGRSLVLRWRPGVVDIGGDPAVALSRGPFILQMPRGAQAPSVSVGLYQTVWRRDTDGVWRVLFDGNASPLRPVADRAAADAWARQQTMSDCAAS